MLRGIYSSASGMLVEERRMDVVANNLANVSTTGYKKEIPITQSFPQLLLQSVDRDETGARRSEVIGPLGTGTYIASTAVRLTSGTPQQTNNPLDFALSGDGFFTVRTPQGIRYTRQGHFLQDLQGNLMTPEGNALLLDDGNPAVAPPGSISIGPRGEVRSGDKLVGRLNIVSTARLGAIRKEGNGLWVQAQPGQTAMLTSGMEPEGSFELRPGFLEGSNVEPVSEMVEMMTVMRTYEANQRAIRAQDEVLQKAVTELGRV